MQISINSAEEFYNFLKYGGGDEETPYYGTTSDSLDVSINEDIDMIDYPIDFVQPDTWYFNIEGNNKVISNMQMLSLNGKILGLQSNHYVTNLTFQNIIIETNFSFSFLCESNNNAGGQGILKNVKLNGFISLTNEGYIMAQVQRLQNCSFSGTFWGISDSRAVQLLYGKTSTSNCFIYCKFLYAAAFPCQFFHKETNHNTNCFLIAENFYKKGTFYVQPGLFMYYHIENLIDGSDKANIYASSMTTQKIPFQHIITTDANWVDEDEYHTFVTKDKLKDISYLQSLGWAI